MTGDNDGLGAKSETNEPPLRLIAGLTGLWSLRLARPSAMGRKCTLALVPVVQVGVALGQAPGVAPAQLLRQDPGDTLSEGHERFGRGQAQPGAAIKDVAQVQSSLMAAGVQDLGFKKSFTSFDCTFRIMKVQDLAHPRAVPRQEPFKRFQRKAGRDCKTVEGGLHFD